MRYDFQTSTTHQRRNLSLSSNMCIVQSFMFLVPKSVMSSNCNTILTRSSRWSIIWEVTPRSNLAEGDVTACCASSWITFNSCFNSSAVTCWFVNVSPCKYQFHRLLQTCPCQDELNVKHKKRWSFGIFATLGPVYPRRAVLKFLAPEASFSHVRA